MASLFKNLLYTGVGVAVQAKEQIETVIQELVKEDKVSTSEGKRIVDEFLQNTDAKKENAEQELSSMVEKLVGTFGFATKTEVEELRNRVTNLETLIAKLDSKPLEVAEKSTPELPESNVDDTKEV